MIKSLINFFFGCEEKNISEEIVVTSSYLPGMKNQSSSNLDEMKKACDLEIKSYEKTGMIPAPGAFEQVTILSKKKKIMLKK